MAFYYVIFSKIVFGMHISKGKSIYNIVVKTH